MVDPDYKDNYQDIARFIAMLLFLGLAYMLKLCFVDHFFGIYTLALFVLLYGLGIVLVTTFIEKRIFDKKNGLIRIDTVYEPKTIVDKLKAMHPKDFEDFIKLLFELSGYTIIKHPSWKKHFSLWKPQSDGGIDLIVSKDGKKTYVQIKKNISNMVSVGMVKEFYSSIFDKLGSDDTGMFITTSIFSSDAEKFADDNRIKRITHKELETEINGLEKQIKLRNQIEEFLSKIDYYKNKQYNQNIKTCKKCGAPLKWRKEGFYGCQNFHKTGCTYKEYK